MTDALATGVARLNSIEKCQERLGVGRSMVFELLKSKKLKSVLVGRRRMVTEQSLCDFIAHLDEQGDTGHDGESGAEQEEVSDGTPQRD